MKRRFIDKIPETAKVTRGAHLWIGFIADLIDAGRIAELDVDPVDVDTARSGIQSAFRRQNTEGSQIRTRYDRTGRKLYVWIEKP